MIEVNRTLEIRHLVTFKTIVDKGGYTKAADFMGYAQSTITSHIQSLEQELGQPLFNRLGKKIKLTEVGENLLPYAKKMIELEKLATQITAPEQEPKGNIIIGASESLTIYRLPPILKTFREKYRHVQIMLKTGSCYELRNELRNGDIDLAFLVDQEKPEVDLEAEILVEEPMVFLFPANITLGKDYKFSQEDTFLYTEKGCSYRQYFEEILKKEGIVGDDTLEFWSVEAIKQCVMSGLGVSMLPLMTVKKELISRKITGQITPPSEKPFVTQMLYHKEKWLSPALHKFLNTVRSEASGWNREMEEFIESV